MGQSTRPSHIEQVTLIKRHRDSITQTHERCAVQPTVARRADFSHGWLIFFSNNNISVNGLSLVKETRDQRFNGSAIRLSNGELTLNNRLKRE